MEFERNMQQHLLMSTGSNSPFHPTPTNLSWSSAYGSNYPATSGDRSHHQPMTPDRLSHWGGSHYPPRGYEKAGFGPPPVDLRYQSTGWTSASAVSSTTNSRSTTGFAVKDELTDPSDYSSEENSSEYPDPVNGSANPDRRGDLGERTRRRTADRKSENDESMTAEEAEKRRIRRERNKMAAARCRQRRMDLTNQLLAETETLEDERDRLQREIQVLQRQRAQLEDLLGSHAPRCKSAALIAAGHVIDIPPIKTEKSDDDYFCMADTGLRRATCNSYSHPGTNFQSCSRPDTLPLTRQRPGPPPPPPPHAASLDQTMGACAAPSNMASMANLGLDCMLDGHTGLTPITGGPIGPDQVVRSPIDCGRYSPTTLMTL